MSLFNFLFGSSEPGLPEPPTMTNPCTGLNESSPGSGVDMGGNVMYTGCDDDSMQSDLFDSMSSSMDDSLSSMDSFSDSFSSFDDSF